MTGTLLHEPVIRAVDDAGAPLSGALLQFYESGTTTPQAVYGDQGLDAPLSNPVVADAGGLFPPIFLDPAVTYRAQLLNSAGTLILDMDPINAVQVIADASVTAAMLAAGAAAANLGFEPVDSAGDTATNLQLAFTAYSQTSAGYLGTPINEQDGNYTLLASDAGKMVRCGITAAMTYTLNAGVFQPGTVILIRNAVSSSATLTIAQGAGITIYGAGGSTAKNWALAPGGLATLIMETTAAANVWVISGSGLS